MGRFCALFERTYRLFRVNLAGMDITSFCTLGLHDIFIDVRSREIAQVYCNHRGARSAGEEGEPQTFCNLELCPSAPSNRERAFAGSYQRLQKISSTMIRREALYTLAVNLVRS